MRYRTIEALEKARNETKESEAQLRKMIDTIPTLAWCNLPDGSNEFLNQRWHDYTGLSPKEAQGWGWKVTIHPDDLQKLMHKWWDLLASGEPGEIEARLRRHDGEYRWFLFRVEPLRDERGNIIRWYGTNTDIENLKRTEEKLRQDERELRLITDVVPARSAINNLVAYLVSGYLPQNSNTSRFCERAVVILRLVLLCCSLPKFRLQNAPPSHGLIRVLAGSTLSAQLISDFAMCLEP